MFSIGEKYWLDVIALKRHILLLLFLQAAIVEEHTPAYMTQIQY